MVFACDKGIKHGGSCDRCSKCRGEELPHFQAQGQKLGGPHARRGAAKRVTPCPRSGAAAESARLRRHRKGREELPKSEVRGSTREELPQERGKGRGLGGATPRPRPEAADGRSYPTPEARSGGRKDQPHVQGAVAAWVQEGLEVQIGKGVCQGCILSPC